MPLIAVVAEVTEGVLVLFVAGVVAVVGVAAAAVAASGYDEAFASWKVCGILAATRPVPARVKIRENRVAIPFSTLTACTDTPAPRNVSSF